MKKDVDYQLEALSKVWGSVFIVHTMEEAIVRNVSREGLPTDREITTHRADTVSEAVEEAFFEHVPPHPISRE